MARTELTSSQIKDGDVARDDMDIATTGQAVITKVIAGANVSLTYTGVDPGTGDVTISFTGGGGGGAGTINYSISVNPGISLSVVLNAIAAQVAAAVSIGLSPHSLRFNLLPGVAVSTYATGTAANIAVNPAPSLNGFGSGAALKPEELAAGKITQIKYDLTRRVGGNATTLSTTNTQGWTSEANAINGTNGRANSSNAAFAGNALATRNGTLQLGYADTTSKTDLVISLVRLHFYINVAGTTLNNADVQLKYNIGGGLVTLQTITGNVTNISTPLTFDITSAVTAGGVQATIWGRIDALITQVVADAALAELWTVALDAIEVEIVGSKTDTL